MVGFSLCKKEGEKSERRNSGLEKDSWLVPLKLCRPSSQINLHAKANIK